MTGVSVCRRSWFAGAVLIGAVLSATSPRARAEPAPQISDTEVDALVDSLIDALRRSHTAGPRPGVYPDEMFNSLHEGGVTALATLALLHAGVPWHDPVIKASLEYLEDCPLPGTYSRSLRAAVYAHLTTRAGEAATRQKAKRLLQQDANWLVKAIKPDGFYGYDIEGLGGDHSCSQFAVLGVWAAESAGAEIPGDYWKKIADHWSAYQSPDGGWAYHPGAADSVTMTTAGVNTLYITLSQYYARMEPRYQRLLGVRGSGRPDRKIDATMAAADKGLGWLSEHGIAGDGYQLFGLERLGVASGLKNIGGVDWYRAGAAALDRRPPGTVQAAFRLLFLTYGRAPVVIGKLRHGSGSGWNHYYRDLHGLTSWMSAKHERIYKWQVVTPDGALHDLLDAPMLLISGGGAIDLSAQQRARLREYVDFGGTIVGHADRGDARFATAFRTMIEGLFADRGWKLGPLPPDHAMFATVYGRDKPGWAEDFRIEGAGDALRTSVVLIPTDLAGAWHQQRDLQHPELFEIMGNLRAYEAPKYEELPRRLRPNETDGPVATPRGYVTVACWGAGGPADTADHRLATFDRLLRRHTDLALVPMAGVRPGDADVLYIAAAAALEPGDVEFHELARAAKAGAVVVFEARGSRPAFVESADLLMKRLAEELGGRTIALPADHPIFTGAVPGGIRPASLRPNRWGGSKLRGETPPIAAIEAGGRIAAVLVPFDLTASACGEFLYDTPGYPPSACRAMLTNLMAWRYHTLFDDAGPPTAARPTKARGAAALAPLAESAMQGGRMESAAAALEVARLVGAGGDDAAGARSTDRREAQRRLGVVADKVKADLSRRIDEAVRGRRHDEAHRLRALLAGVAPESAGAAGNADEPHQSGEAVPTARAEQPEAPPPLPEALDAIEVTFNDQKLSAGTLLAEWFKWDALREKAKDELRELDRKEKALIAEAEELIRARALRERDAPPGAKPPRVRDPALEVIRRKREAIAEQRTKAGGAISTLEGRMNQITNALREHAAQLAAEGVRLEKNRWIVGGE